MKFIYADSLDYVDPNFDFVEDRNGKDRTPYWDDQFTHEILDDVPYDGVLVSRGIVGDHRVPGKYTHSQAMRFRRVGAREFLRLKGRKLSKLWVFGDCGAFTYHKEHVPPYSSEEVAEFYDDCGFTHGCSVDHIIFEFDDTVTALKGGSEDARHRYDITLENARSFLKETKKTQADFTPIGVVQGWSPASMGRAAKKLVKMGYDYIALGGMVPLRTPQIKQCLTEVREQIGPDVKIHILGFAKADDIGSFQRFGITSFDTTSPLLRAFKDSRNNYYRHNDEGKLDYYSALRIPQATVNPKLNRLVMAGAIRQEELLALEKRALTLLRAYDKRKAKLTETLDAVMEYANPEMLISRATNLPGVRTGADQGVLRDRYEHTLREKPWKHCTCRICQDSSIEVMIFRGSNRNKRRGMHNIGVFNTMVKNLKRSRKSK